MQKLGKVLALADSAHEGEALAALRTARALLQQNGIDLSRVLDAALHDEEARRKGKKNRATQLDLLRLQQRLEVLEAETELWKKEAQTAREALEKSEKERARWHRLANDTMEKLWKIAQAIREGEPEEKLDRKAR